MKESILATLVFWSAFAFSIGPFWIATMEAAKDTSFKVLYRDYVIYMLVGWLPLNMVIGITVGTIGAVNRGFYTVLYFVGATVILWLAVKTMKRNVDVGKAFVFNWKTMTLVAWINPKVWLTVPAGYLAATYTQSLVLNALIFFILGVPLFLAGVYFWGMLGRQGAKISGNLMGYFNATLLVGFALYLVYQGIELINSS